MSWVTAWAAVVVGGALPFIPRFIPGSISVSAQAIAGVFIFCVMVEVIIWLLSDF